MVGLTSSTLLAIFASMVRMRNVEEEALRLIDLSEIGSIHAYMGQEAVAAGISMHIRSTDYFISNHRAIGHYLAKGGNMTALMAELIGKADGCSRGKGGEMHLVDPDVGFLGSFPIIGACISIATGVALSIKHLHQDRIAVCFFGEGAANNGCFHEALNIASVYALPVLYVCENNGLTINLPSREVSARERVADRAGAYAINSATVDGHDPIAVYKAAEGAVKCVRDGRPFLLEAITTRLRPHKEHLHDPRDRSELRDSLHEFENYLRRSKLVEESQIEDVRERIRSQVSIAVKSAMNAAWPEPSAALSDNW